LEDDTNKYPERYSLETAITQASIFKSKIFKLPTENSRDSFEKKITDEKFFIDNNLKNASSMKTSVLILVNTSLGGFYFCSRTIFLIFLKKKKL